MNTAKNRARGDLIRVEDYTEPDTGKRMSAKAVVRVYLGNMPQGASRPVLGLVDTNGNRRDRHFQTMVSQVGRELGRIYVTRDMGDGNLCHVWRIA